MKSTLPEKPVAMTGRPSAIASARPSPNPSARCRETKQPQLATSASRSAAVT